ncbi:MAG: GPW/gp25 family protein [Bacteroidota bacterium]
MSTHIHSIRYPFAIDRGIGSLAEENNYDRHIEQMIKQVLFTNPGERINRPDFGCGLRRMIFAPNNNINANLLQVTVFQSLEKWLGNLIQVEEIQAESVEENLRLNITYFVKARQQRRYLNLDISL